MRRNIIGRIDLPRKTSIMYHPSVVLARGFGLEKRKKECGHGGGMRRMIMGWLEDGDDNSVT
jgi:hypothetical protein